MKPKLLMLLAACLLVTPLTFIQTGCTTSQQRITYNTLYSLETGTTAAYDAFLDQVVAAKIEPSKVQNAAKAYDAFQAGMSGAIAAAKFNWQAPAPADVTALATTVLNAILQAQGKL